MLEYRTFSAFSKQKSNFVSLHGHVPFCHLLLYITFCYFLY